MVLLQWCQLRPQGPTSDIAAVLFRNPVQLSSICIFPTGAQPFKQSPATVAHTEPEAFFLDVFFNSLPLQANPSQDAQQKDKRNVLVPTRIAYAGGWSEFAVDMGAEYATRLVVFQGQFQEISMAIYGSVVADAPEILDYESKSHPVLNAFPLSPAIDVANSAHPTFVVEQLLATMISPAPLPLIIRLMFCLKPEKEDWDNPDFPYVYCNVDDILSEEDDGVRDLEGLLQSASKPLREDVSSETLTKIAGKMESLMGSDISDDAYYVAKLLTKAACQQIVFSRVLLQHIDLVNVFNERSLDETIVHCLLEAAANIEISRYFTDDSIFMSKLESMKDSHMTEKPIQLALKRLLARIQGWLVFEDALVNPNGDFPFSITFLKDISVDESALGNWLECMLNHEDLRNKLSSNPVPSEPRSMLAPLFADHPTNIPHGSFIMFVRAFLGVSTVLAMLAWSDSMGDEKCCERTLHILVTWQGVDGYREILNHCLLLRQMARRLAWVKNDVDEQRPKRGGVLAEKLLLGLIQEPRALLRTDLVTNILALKPPFCYITSEQQLEMEKLAHVAEDGLPAALEELAYESQRPFSLRRMRVLRVSLAIVHRHLESENGDSRILDFFWTTYSQAFLTRLITILSFMSEDLNRHLALDRGNSPNPAICELLFWTGTDLLIVIAQFMRASPLMTRDIRTLTTAAADLHACADLATMTFSPTLKVFVAAESIQQECSAVLSSLTTLTTQTEAGILVAQVLLCALLEHAHNESGRDPVHHIQQIHVLVDSVLSRHTTELSAGNEGWEWPTFIFPKLLSELKTFSRLLEPLSRINFIDRLVQVDNDAVGIGEWLLSEELKDISTAFLALSTTDINSDYRRVLEYQLASNIHLCELFFSSPTSSKWSIPATAHADTASYLDLCLSLILDANISSLSLSRLTRVLSKCAVDLSPDIRFTILLLILRHAQMDTSLAGALDFVPKILETLPKASINSVYLRNEIGRVLAAYSEQASLLKPDTVDLLLQLIEWLAAQEDTKLTTLTGVKADNFDYLCTAISSLLPADRQQALSTARAKLTLDEDECLIPPPVELPETISLPIQSLSNLLSPSTEPATPKAGTKTPDILGVLISPPTAILRSPAATGLTKMYANNDFRQLRQATSTRMNTSRLPSRHVDDFEVPQIVPMDLLPALTIDPMNPLPLSPISRLAFPGLPES